MIPNMTKHKRNIVLTLSALFMLGACTGPFQSPSSTRKPTPASREARAYANYIYRGDVARTGVYDAGGGPYFGDVLWQFKENYYSTAPVIAGGLAFVATLSNSGLQVIDLKSGLLQSTLHSKNEHSAVPTVADGILYYEGTDGLHARDIATGNGELGVRIRICAQLARCLRRHRLLRYLRQTRSFGR